MIHRLRNTACAGIALLFLLLPSPTRAQIGGEAGSSTRIGFGARGMAMGNAMSAVDEGELSAYYNPALLPFAQHRGGSIAAGFLSLDRSFNTLSFTVPLPPQAGLSVGIINSGVSDIDGRDADGRQTGSLKTAENTAYLGFGLRFPAGFSLGVTVKFLYSHLYTDVTSKTMGVDIGASMRLAPWVRASVTIRDIGSKYKWDTVSLYGEDAQPEQDQFPRLYTLGLAFTCPDIPAILATEIETSNKSTVYLRFGAEYPVLPEVVLRAGVDRIDLKEAGSGVRPAAGFLLQKDFGKWTPAINYTYVFEPFSPSGVHMVSLSAIF